MKNTVRDVSHLIWERLPRIILFTVLILFAWGAYQMKQNTDATVNNTSATKKNTEATQQLVEDLQVAVDDLKDDNARQTRFIECILALHGEGRLVSEDVRLQCEKMSSRVDITDVTRQPDAPGTQTAPATPESEQQPQSPTPPDNTPPEPPEPPRESVLPFVDEPLIGCRMGICI